VTFANVGELENPKAPLFTFTLRGVPMQIYIEDASEVFADVIQEADRDHKDRDQN
jgi:hypothetical protein